MATKKTVPAPKGFHWMKSGKGFKLMKNPPGGFKPHPGRHYVRHLTYRRRTNVRSSG